MFLAKGVLKICKLQSNFIEISLWHECSSVSLLHIFRTPFHKNTHGGLLLQILKKLHSLFTFYAFSSKRFFMHLLLRQTELQIFKSTFPSVKSFLYVGVFTFASMSDLGNDSVRSQFQKACKVPRHVASSSAVHCDKQSSFIFFLFHFINL